MSSLLPVRDGAGWEEGGDAAPARRRLQELKLWMQKSGQRSPACRAVPKQLTAGRSPLGMKMSDRSLNESR